MFRLRAKGEDFFERRVSTGKRLLEIMCTAANAQKFDKYIFGSLHPGEHYAPTALPRIKSEQILQSLTGETPPHPVDCFAFRDCRPVQVESYPLLALNDIMLYVNSAARDWNLTVLITTPLGQVKEGWRLSVAELGVGSGWQLLRTNDH